MRQIKTHFEKIPVAVVKKKMKEKEIKERIRIEGGCREIPAEKTEPYSVPVVNKFRSVR